MMGLELDRRLETMLGLLDTLQIFARVDAAGGIDDSGLTAGREEFEGFPDEAFLDAREAVELAGLRAIPGLGASREDAGVGAGDIEEDQVERTGMVAQGVERDDGDVGQVASG